MVFDGINVMEIERIMNEKELQECLGSFHQSHPVISVGNYMLWAYASIPDTPREFDICDGQYLWSTVKLETLTIDAIENAIKKQKPITDWRHSKSNINNYDYGLFYRASQMPENITSEYPDWFVSDFVLWKLQE